MERLSRRVIGQMGGSGVSVWGKVLNLAKIPGVVDLGQGFPDIPPSTIARATAAKACLQQPPGPTNSNQYSPVPGCPELVAALGNWHKRRYGRGFEPNEVVITCSGTEALNATLMAICDPGDEVIVFEPFFPWYKPCVELAGAVPQYIKLKSPDFCVSEDDLARTITKRTKAIIFNTPHNPSGHVAGEDELTMIAKYCIEHDIIAISDEVYEAAVFQPSRHRRLVDVDGMRSRTITIGSAGKIFNLTGWRIGWTLGPEDLTAGIRAMHGYLTFSAPTPLQLGIAAALDEEGEEFYRCIAEQFQENMKILAEALTKLGLQVCNSTGGMGGYFLVADVRSSGMEALEYCEWLAKAKKVAAVPLSVFYSESPSEEEAKCTLVRFAICKKRETIEAAAANLLAE